MRSAMRARSRWPPPPPPARCREVQLRVRLRFRVATPSGQLLLPASDLLLTRDMSYNETAALAKQQEELLLYRAMEDDIVAQVLRRLSSIKLNA